MLEIRPDYAEAHNNLGLALAGLGKFDGAAACFRKALQLNPRDAGTHYNLGQALACCGRLDEAIAQYRQAVEIEPDFAKARKNLAPRWRAVAGSMKRKYSIEKP